MREKEGRKKERKKEVKKEEGKVKVNEMYGEKCVV